MCSIRARSQRLARAWRSRLDRRWVTRRSQGRARRGCRSRACPHRLRSPLQAIRHCHGRRWTVPRSRPQQLPASLQGRQVPSRHWVLQLSLGHRHHLRIPPRHSPPPLGYHLAGGRPAVHRRTARASGSSVCSSHLPCAATRHHRCLPHQRHACRYHRPADGHRLEGHQLGERKIERIWQACSIQECRS